MNFGKWVSVNGFIELPFESEFVLVKAACIGKNGCTIKKIGARLYYVRKERFQAFKGARYIIDFAQDIYFKKVKL